MFSNEHLRQRVKAGLGGSRILQNPKIIDGISSHIVNMYDSIHGNMVPTID